MSAGTLPWDCACDVGSKAGRARASRRLGIGGGVPACSPGASLEHPQVSRGGRRARVPTEPRRPLYQGHLLSTDDLAVLECAKMEAGSRRGPCSPARQELRDFCLRGAWSGPVFTARQRWPQADGHPSSFKYLTTCRPMGRRRPRGRARGQRQGPGWKGAASGGGGTVTPQS